MTIRNGRILRTAAVVWAAAVCVGVGFRVLADCSSFGLPFTDLDSESTFCAAIAEAYDTGITNGTSATTFSPNDPLTRAAGAAFATRALDGALTRGSRRAALGQWWTTTPHWDAGLGLTAVGAGPEGLQSDGNDIWVANYSDGSVSRVRARDGKLLDTWTGATGAFGVLVAMGRVFVTGGESSGPGSLYMIDPSHAAGTVTTIASDLGLGSIGLAFDGDRIWVANGNVVSIVAPAATTPWSVTTVSGFSSVHGALFDGLNIWVTDFLGGSLLRLDSSGEVIQTVNVGAGPQFPIFDGRNIWVPVNGTSSLVVVRASDGAIQKTFSGGNGDQNGLFFPSFAAFDGRRVLVTNENDGVSLFSAADLSPIGTVRAPTFGIPTGACSDGIDFWIGFQAIGRIGRF